MHARIRHITIDCRDPYTLSTFWAEVLGFVDDPDNPNHPGDPEALIVDPAGLHPGLLFIPVPEPKSAKNRVHLDLLPERPRDITVDDLLARGATLLDDQRRPDGAGWAVLADLECNEFCVERSNAERGIGPPVDTGSKQPWQEGIETAAELDQLVGLLDWYREAVLRKVDGVSSRVASTSPLRSGRTIAGVLKHLAVVEDAWFTDDFAGLPFPEPWASAPWDDDNDWEWHTATDDSFDDLVELYRQACERSRQAVAGHDLDEPAVNAKGRPFKLRFAYVHMIEETARHAGHLDILRELLDGTTGE